jgi:hypothetical protein
LRDILAKFGEMDPKPPPPAKDSNTGGTRSEQGLNGADANWRELSTFWRALSGWMPYSAHFSTY